MKDTIDTIALNRSLWLSGEGQDSDIVISSRARLARNLQNTLFVEKASGADLNRIIADVRNVVENSVILRDAAYVDVESLDENGRQFFVERHLISSDFADSSNPRALMFRPDEGMSIMINEEDHLRMQSLYPGFALEAAWDGCHQLDREFSNVFQYAYSERFGYLTACPTNVGTGARFSVFLHLPVLIFTKKVERVFSDLIPSGIAVRGFYGEGSEVVGNLFQVSNQYTLGWTEQGLLDRIIPIIRRVIQEEREAREKVLSDNRILIEDKIYRALGLIQHARILSSIETLDLLSALRLGVDMGIVPPIKSFVFNELMIQTQPVHLQRIERRSLDERERDILRAEVLRKRLHLN